MRMSRRSSGLIRFFSEILSGNWSALRPARMEFKSAELAPLSSCRAFCRVIVRLRSSRSAEIVPFSARMFRAGIPPGPISQIWMSVRSVPFFSPT